jgi:hypothetical protein
MQGSSLSHHTNLKSRTVRGSSRATSKRWASTFATRPDTILDIAFDPGLVLRGDQGPISASDSIPSLIFSARTRTLRDRATGNVGIVRIFYRGLGLCLSLPTS